jgi:hypothetical protein
MPRACWSAPQAAVDAAYAKKIEAMLPPKVECVASSSTVAAGQSVTLTARVEGSSAGLVYSFSSNGGRLYPDGPTARLDTTGMPAGRTISATCQVTNALGRRGSSDAVVRIVAMETAHLPESSTAPPTRTSAAGGGHQRVVVEHDVQTAQGAKNRAPASASSPQAEAEEIPPGAVPPPAAAAAAAPPPPAAGGVDPYQASELQAQWVGLLKNGKIEYLIPTQMKLHETSVVTVVVHGFADTGQNQLVGAKEGTLKVSPYMRMQLTADDNPDEFEIDPKVGAVLPVPIDSSAKWTWNVVPKQPANNQKLTIEAFLVYTENGDNPQELLPSYVATVSVSVPGFWESLREEFWNNPSGAIKYVLPGGAGFTALAGLIVWWWKRRHPSESKPDKEE